ncbi:MAG: hypothetical protein C0506_05005 [Anaerolinea sp.]|nr:hypothetical protein [Anaerolinea sp.]
MARRERTTGLPRPRPRANARNERRVAGVRLSDRNIRFGVLGGSAALLVIVLFLLGYRWYDENIARPNSSVLTVAGDEYSLEYYTDRLFQFAQLNQSSGTNPSLLEQALLQKLEEEALALKLAAEKGITISEQDITNQIGVELGVPVGGSGSSFATLYRQKLKDLKMSDGNYRRLTEAQIAHDRLLLEYEKEVGSTGETVTLRAVLSPSKEAADAVVARINAGEDMGTVAQQDSTDLASRQKDGLLDPGPQALLPEQARNALEGKADGELIGPVDVDGNFWVFRIEKRDPEGALTTAQTTDLAERKLEEAIEALRATTTIKRSLDPSDIKWAENHIE